MVHPQPTKVVPLPPKVTPAPPTPEPKPVVLHTTPKPTAKPDRLYFPTTPTPIYTPTPTPIYHPKPTPVYGYRPYHSKPKAPIYHPAPVVHPVPAESVLHELKPRQYGVPKVFGHHAPIPKAGYIPTPAPYHGPPTPYPTPYSRPDVYRPKEDPYVAARKAAGKIGASRRKSQEWTPANGGYIG